MSRRHSDRVANGSQKPSSVEYKLHPLVLKVFPIPTLAEISAAKERVGNRRRHGLVEAIDGLIVTGFLEYSVRKELGLATVVTAIDEPHDLVDHIVRGNLPPADYGDNARGCIAVLAHMESCQERARERMREGGRHGGRNKGKGRVESARSFGGDDPKRWFHEAARIVDVAPWMVKTLARLIKKAPDMFEAVRAKRIDKPHRAHEFVRNLPEPADREIVLQRYEAARAAKKTVRLLDLAFEYKRESARATRSAGLPEGKDYVIYTGDMTERAAQIPDHTVDLMVADVVYGRPDLAEQAAKIGALKLVPGGLLVLMCGHERFLESVNAAASHLAHVDAIGFIDIAGSNGGGVRGTRTVQRRDADPVFFFEQNGHQPRRVIRSVRYRSEVLDKEYHRWQKPRDAMTHLFTALMSEGARLTVLDPCCGGGTTGEVALRLGCTFIGIDIDPQAASDTSSRLSAVERELEEAEKAKAAAEVTRIANAARLLPMTTEASPRPGVAKAKLKVTPKKGRASGG